MVAMNEALYMQSYACHQVAVLHAAANPYHLGSRMGWLVRSYIERDSES